MAMQAAVDCGHDAVSRWGETATSASMSASKSSLAQKKLLCLVANHEP